MRKGILRIGALLTFISPILTVTAGDEYKPNEDKLYHLGVSTVIGFSANYVMEDWRYALGACTAVGLAKEVYDQLDYGGASIGDLAYDVVGCAIGVSTSEYLGIKMAVIPEKNQNGFTIALQYDF